MNFITWLSRWRDWLPVPTRDGKLHLIRWVLLEAHRLAITGILLLLVFATIMLIARAYTFEMQRILVETSSVQMVLNTLLSGMILLVSVVVSINSSFLSYDLTSIEIQEDRIQGAMEFRRRLGELTETGESPSDPATFLTVMARAINERAEALKRDAEGMENEAAEEFKEYANTISDATDRLEGLDDTTGADFGVLWKGIEFDYGPYMDRSRMLESSFGSTAPDDVHERLDHLLEAFELFAIGKEYFKTLYYTREVSQLSRVLLIIALPSILFNASTILAIDAGILPDIWFLGLPPLQSFVASVFTVSLAPYLVLTSYTLRLATVARVTSSSGTFSLQ
jgi:hypothetical protein